MTRDLALNHAAGFLPIGDYQIALTQAKSIRQSTSVSEPPLDQLSSNDSPTFIRLPYQIKPNVLIMDLISNG